ncbi:MAG: hypothetical protein R3A12_11400 [Ignavibacteria bacterium]
MTETARFLQCSSVISPDGEKFAFISNQDDQFDVFIAKTKNGEIIDEVVSGNTSSDFEELHILTPGLSWSPDGKKIALSAKAGDKDVIYIIDIKTEERKTLPLSFDMIKLSTNCLSEIKLHLSAAEMKNQIFSHTIFIIKNLKC